ncbi:hypothetical protein D9756_005486 [Leucocoprinus leucothites]|uniref:Uncharacterized protein n=1 Tax=Leucocoprinus leucothites TaxID=201217 RepID=A0A8H5FZY1_9AGAR|nr:hypothetical protein D9756_005486 [Leucoagaricus leucothites]
MPPDEYKAPNVIYLPSQRLETPCPVHINAATVETEVFGPFINNHPDDMGHLHGCAAGIIDEPGGPRLPSIYPFCHLGRKKYLSVLPAVDPSSKLVPAPLPSHRLPPCSDGETTRSFQSCIPSPPPLAPRAEESYFLDARTMEENLPIHDLITLAVVSFSAAWLMKAKRASEEYDYQSLEPHPRHEVPVFLEEAREFEHRFEALKYEPRVPISPLQWLLEQFLKIYTWLGDMRTNCQDHPVQGVKCELLGDVLVIWMSSSSQTGRLS